MYFFILLEFYFLEKSFVIQNLYLYLFKYFKLRVIAKKALVDFYTKHADSKVYLEDWYEKVSEANWQSFSDVKQLFNSVDYVGNDRFVFNIRGNNYRLVALILFIPKRVYIRFVGTHSEYDTITDIKNI